MWDASLTPDQRTILQLRARIETLEEDRDRLHRHLVIAQNQLQDAIRERDEAREDRQQALSRLRDIQT